MWNTLNKTHRCKIVHLKTTLEDLNHGKAFIFLIKRKTPIKISNPHVFVLKLMTPIHVIAQNQILLGIIMHRLSEDEIIIFKKKSFMRFCKNQNLFEILIKRKLSNLILIVLLH